MCFFDLDILLHHDGSVYIYLGRAAVFNNNAVGPISHFRELRTSLVAMGIKNAGRKYLVLGPGQEEPGNGEDYIVRHSPTFNIFLGVRLTDPDPEKGKGALMELKMYPYAQRDNPPKTEILDTGTKAWSGLPPRGMEYWERLNDVIQKEPIATRDIFYHDMLRSLGIEKGKSFKPDARQKKIFTEAALVGEAMAKANSADRRFADVKYRRGAHWDFALQLNADDPENFWNLLDQRASWFYEAVGAGPSMAPKRPGPSSAYLSNPGRILISSV